MIVGNEYTLPIESIGYSSLKPLNSTFIFKLNQLFNILHVSHNLMSIQKLCLDNYVLFKFYFDSVFVEDVMSKTILARGKDSEGLYSLEGII